MVISKNRIYQGVRPLGRPLLYIALLIPLGLVGCNGKGQSKAPQADGEGKPVLVRVAPAQIMNLQEVETYSGLVQPFEEYQICPGLAGRIKRVLVDVGAPVRKGQLLVEMDPTKLLTLKTQYNTLLRDYERLDTLYRIGSISKQQHDQMQSQVEVMREQVANLEENIRLTSPIDGVVTGRYFNGGELFSMAPTPASAGRAAILTVMQLNPVKVRFSAPEEFYGRIAPQMPVSMTLSAYKGREFSGRIYRKSPTLSPVAHTFDVEVTAPNGDGALKPGMYTQVDISFGHIARAMVPDLAVQHQRGTNTRFVYIVEGDSVRQVVVKTGERYKGFIEIREGLSGHERVVTSGIKQLQDGSRIEIVNE